MPIENRNLKVGTKLVGRYHKQSYSCEVVEAEGDKLRYRLEDGREFKSPSAAGMAITGHACDGWVFWSVETAESAPISSAQQTEAQEEPPVEPIEAKDAEDKGATTEEQNKTPIEAAHAEEEPGPAKKRIFRLPNQKGAQEGKVRWYCHDCGKSFFAKTGETPEACPQGHKAN